MGRRGGIRARVGGRLRSLRTGLGLGCRRPQHRDHETGIDKHVLRTMDMYNPTCTVRHSLTVQPSYRRIRHILSRQGLTGIPQGTTAGATGDHRGPQLGQGLGIRGRVRVRVSVIMRAMISII